MKLGFFSCWTKARLLVMGLTSMMLVMSACTQRKTENSRSGKVERGDVIQRTSLNGTLRGARQSQVQPGYSGYVGKVFVKVGDRVKAGDPLVSMLQTINQPLSEVFPIRAPYAGVVTQVLQREGEYVAASSGAPSTSSTLLILDDMSQMWIDTNIPEVDVAKVSVGLEAQIRANALQGKTYSGTVQTLSLSARQSSDRWDRGRVEYPAEIRVSDPDPQLKPGMTVVIDVISAKAEGVLTVRHEYVHRKKNEVYVIDDKDEKHSITTGLSNEDVIEVKSGVTEGMVVKMKDFSKL